MHVHQTSPTDNIRSNTSNISNRREGKVQPRHYTKQGIEATISTERKRDQTIMQSSHTLHNFEC